MSATAINGEPVSLTGDPRWELVQRIVVSPCFSKSERLSSFLLFVCRLSLLGQSQQINEQHIGRTVFGRKPDYDTAADGIVRSHATRLRLKLAQYFRDHGGNESMAVEIPPGSYVPVFTPREKILRAASPQLDPQRIVAPPMPANEAIERANESPGADQIARPRKTTRIRHIAVASAFAWMALSIVYLVTHPKFATEIRAEWKGARHPLWPTIFNKHDDTFVVSGDIALMNFEIQTGRSVMLGEYTRNNYVSQYMAQFDLQSFSPSSALFLTKSMTVVDSQFIEGLYRLPGVNLERTQFVPARDIQLPDLQRGNVVLLGDFRVNPWVQAFEPRMNFYFANNDGELTNSVLMNRSPRGDERASYRSADIAHLHTEYGLVAFQPNLSGSGNALLLEGQSEMSTEAAENFLESDAALLPFLNKIRKRDGFIPHFELALEVKGMSGSASSSNILAYRIDNY